MAKDKEPQTSDDRVAKLEAELAATRIQVDKLLVVVAKNEGAMTAEQQAAREWAKLSAEEKTKLEVVKRFPEAPGDAKFQCLLISEKGKVDGFPLTIPAHSPEEADARYRRLMGITNTTGTIQVARAQAAA